MNADPQRTDTAKRGAVRQDLRHLAQVAFFVLFVAAPVFDLLRYDLVAGHAWFLGMEWHVGFDDYSAGRIGLGEITGNVLLRIFVPILGVGAALLLVAWRWGRLYCGWLCPHFSVVETINRLMLRALGKPSLWDDRRLPPREPDGTPIRFVGTATTGANGYYYILMPGGTVTGGASAVLAASDGANSGARLDTGDALDVNGNVSNFDIWGETLISESMRRISMRTDA